MTKQPDKMITDELHRRIGLLMTRETGTEYRIGRSTKVIDNEHHVKNHLEDTESTKHKITEDDNRFITCTPWWNNTTYSVHPVLKKHEKLMTTVKRMQTMCEDNKAIIDAREVQLAKILQLIHIIEQNTDNN